MRCQPIAFLESSSGGFQNVGEKVTPEESTLKINMCKFEQPCYERTDHATAERGVTKFIVEGNVLSSEIHHRLQKQYQEKGLPQTCVFEWLSDSERAESAWRMNSIMEAREHPSQKQTADFSEWMRH
ncbi:hypothetical protein AVEN_41786-1 [Araneus ventricosus]|uniref:Uncharacterized protein n=1 Tax=Araneus ventricosus TaxID=182803 RepID=A0A4Y2ABV8_ARAVE|nr:hypothetical protein AVEN_41786-1 [Araneus ventricosus]